MPSLMLPAAVIVGAALASFAFGAETDRYPSRPIRIVVPFTPGGSNDLIGRVIGTKLTESWGQPVIIDNRPGGGSTIGAQVVVNPGSGPGDLAEHGGGGGAVPDARNGVDQPVDGDVLVDRGCWWFGCAQQEQPGVQFIA